MLPCPVFGFLVSDNAFPTTLWQRRPDLPPMTTREPTGNRTRRIGEDLMHKLSKLTSAVEANCTQESDEFENSSELTSFEKDRAVQLFNIHRPSAKYGRKRLPRQRIAGVEPDRIFK
jgi:hypothetical protein